MDISRKNFADIELIKKIISSNFPEAHELNFNESGFDNIVVLLDKKYAIRFPRRNDSYIRDTYEKIVLDGLKNLKSLHISEVVETNEEPPYFVTKFLFGKHCSSLEITQLSESVQIEFAHKVAEFIFELESLLSVDYILHAREQLQLDMHEETWKVYLEKHVKQRKFPTKEQDELAKEYYQRWLDINKESNQIVVHDDLHTENMLFEGDKLSGILDFANTNIGMPEQEFRQLYRINDVVLDAAIEKYNMLSTYKLDTESIKVWAVIQEISMFSVRFFANQTDHQSFLRTSHNLNRWIGGDWGKGFVTDQVYYGKQ